MKRQKLIDLINTINPRFVVPEGLRPSVMVGIAKHEVLHLQEELRRATDKIEPFPASNDELADSLMRASFPAPRTWADSKSDTNKRVAERHGLPFVNIPMSERPDPKEWAASTTPVKPRPETLFVIARICEFRIEFWSTDRWDTNIDEAYTCDVDEMTGQHPFEMPAGGQWVVHPDCRRTQK